MTFNWLTAARRPGHTTATRQWLIVSTAGLVAVVGCTRGLSPQQERCLVEARAAAEEGRIADALAELNRSRSAKETPRGCILRAEVYCKLQKLGNALDELTEATERWPNNDDLRGALSKCIVDDAKLRVNAERERVSTIDDFGEKLQREIAELQLRRLVNESAYWANHPAAQRDAYLDAVLAKSNAKVIRDAALRGSIVSETPEETEANIQNELRKREAD